MYRRNGQSQGNIVQRRRERAGRFHLVQAALFLLFLLPAGGVLLSTGAARAAQEGKPGASWRATLIPARRCRLATSRAGVIARFHVAEGESFAKGRVIVELDPAESKLVLTEAEAVLAAAESGMERARGEVESLETLYACENATFRRLKLARADLAIAAARRREARARLEQARLALLRCRIQAPFAGRLLVRRREPGEAVGAYTVVCDLVDCTTLHAVIQVSPAELEELRRRERVWFHHDTGRVHPGRVERVGVELNPGSRKLRVRVAVPNGQGSLWAGDGGRVTLEKE